jgi:hypothetical protein
VTELNIATYRNILASESSSQKGPPLKRSSINHKLTVICQFYRFAHHKGWIDALPFEVEQLEFLTSGYLTLRTGLNCHVLVGNSLRLRESTEELRIPP